MCAHIHEYYQYMNIILPNATRVYLLFITFSIAPNLLLLCEMCFSKMFPYLPLIATCVINS